MPPAGVLRKTLAGITETLAGEIVRPSPNAPSWSETQWRLARAVSAIHGISGLLARRPWPDAPTYWRSFLYAQRDHIAGRDTRIEATLAQIDSAARREGIAVLGMKGSALRRLEAYDAGERPMADVDLLARPESLEDAARLLQSAGFRETEVIARHYTFEPQDSRAPALLGECSANDIKIELHTRTMEELPLQKVDITDVIFPPGQTVGLRPYPSTSALMLHLILHAAGNMVIRTLRLVQLHDLARLTSRMSDVEWEGLLRLACNNGQNGWWLYPPLKMMQKYTGTAAPGPVLDHALRGCPRKLVAACGERELASFSLCDPWVAAFPALYWTRFGPERARYLWTRASRSEISKHRHKAFQGNSTLAGAAWHRLSPARRIVSWAAGRAPRIGTLAAIEAAFAEPL